MIKALVLSAVLFSAIACHAEEVRIACLFDRPISVPEMDAEASELRQGFMATNIERVVLLELKPPKVLDGDFIRMFPDGPSAAKVREDSIQVFWSADKHPRRPAMHLTVNRFSLEAVEYFQIKKPGPGLEVYNWTRAGKCKVDKRKF